MRVIGFTGMPGSGKSEAMLVAQDLHIPVIRMGDLVWEEVERQGLPRTAAHVGDVANAMRESQGKDVWALRTVERIRPMRVPRVIIDGVRNLEEVETFRRELGTDFTLVAIHTEPDERFRRMQERARADDSSDVGVLRERDRREMGWGIARVIALADHMLVNAGGLEDFRRSVRALLGRLG